MAKELFSVKVIRLINLAYSSKKRMWCF